MMAKKRELFKWLHRWPGLIIAFVLLWYGFSGIMMNHREILSGVDLSRRVMPSIYQYVNWNNAALKGNITIGRDSILVYGNIGIWLTDTAFSNFSSFNDGFPRGIDNRKISDVHLAPDGSLYAAAFSGLYGYDRGNGRWVRFNTDDTETRFTGIESIGDTIYALNRSYLFSGKSEGLETHFVKKELPAPPGYDGKVTLFQTVWQIHSGEIFGLSGKIYVDILGLVTIFLSLTGIIWFFFPGLIRRRVKRKKDVKPLVKTGKWSLKWHNSLGFWIFPLLIILYFTGTFLRPPLLITIAESRVRPIFFSSLNQPNPWNDKLRDILYDPLRHKLLVSTYDGIYFMDPVSLKPEAPPVQPPVSIMGITVFSNYKQGFYLVGSFNGLFLWHPENGLVVDLMTGNASQGASSASRPVGDYKVTGMITDNNGYPYLVDYTFGTIPLRHDHAFPAMPENIIRESKISLWNIALEIHTGRIFEKLIGGFYILIVPLAGITAIITVISGYVLLRRKKRRSVPKEGSE